VTLLLRKKLYIFVRSPKPTPLNQPSIKEPLELLLAQNEFTLLERRIYWCVLKALKEDQTLDGLAATGWPENLNREFKIHHSELYYNDTKPNFKEVERAARRILGRKIYHKDPGASFVYLVPFPYVRYEAGYIYIKMLSDVLPHFVNLSRGYSQYQLKSAIALTSEYAQLLYPRLARFLDTGFWHVDVDDLRGFLQAEKYPRYSNFKQRVLQVSLKEINDRSDITVEMEERKEGRNVRALTFRIRKKHERAVEYENFKAEVATGLSLPIDHRRAAAAQTFPYYRLTKKQEKEILNDEEKLNDYIRAESYVAQGVGDIKNPTAYIAASVFGKGKKA